MNWPEDKANQLRILWPDNTAVVIGEILGYPRNAVIGKALRMKLARKKANNSEWRKAKEMEAKKPKPEKIKPIPFKKSTKFIEYVPKLKPLIQSEPLHIKMMDLNNTHCRELTGKCEDLLPTYCGQPVTLRSYCAEHAAKYLRNPNSKIKINKEIKTKISKYY